LRFTIPEQSPRIKAWRFKVLAAGTSWGSASDATHNPETTLPDRQGIHYQPLKIGRFELLVLLKYKAEY